LKNKLENIVDGKRVFSTIKTLNIEPMNSIRKYNSDNTGSNGESFFHLVDYDSHITNGAIQGSYYKQRGVVIF